jgi:hypothetical protein
MSGGGTISTSGGSVTLSNAGVTSFNGSTGSITGVNSVNTKTGSVSLTSADFLPTAGSVGSYALLAQTSLSTTAINLGDSVAGSSLLYFGFQRGTNAWTTDTDRTANGVSSGTPSGTWRAMSSSANNTNSQARAALFLRIA